MVEQEGGALDVVDADAQDYESELEQEAARSASAPAASPIKPESSAAASATTLASPARANTANGHAEFSKVSPSKAKRKALEENVKMSVRNFVFSSEVQQIRQFQGDYLVFVVVCQCVMCLCRCFFLFFRQELPAHVTEKHR